MWVIPKRTPRYPKSLEREYARLLVRYVDENMKGIRTYRDEMKTLVEAYSVRIDGVDITSHIDVLMDRLKNVMKSPEQMRLSIEKIFDRVNAFNLQELETSIKSVLGAMLRDLPNGRVHQDDVNDDLETLKAIWVKQNLDLIKSIDEQTLAKIRQELEREIVGNAAGARKTSELVARIEKIAGVERNRAALIGSDQVGKLNSRLAQYRQQGAGITHYTWQTAHDRRVRPSHQQYDGRTFTWEQGSPEGHPGEPVRCRCVAIPVIDLDRVPVKARENSYYRLGEKGVEGNLLAARKNPVASYDLSLPKYKVIEDLESVNKAEKMAAEMGISIDNSLGKLKNGSILMEALKYLKERKDATGVMVKAFSFIKDEKLNWFAEYLPPQNILQFDYPFLNSRKLLDDMIADYKRKKILPKGAGLKYMMNHEWAHMLTVRIADKYEKEIYVLIQKYRKVLISENAGLSSAEFLADTVAAYLTPSVDCVYAEDVIKFLADKGVKVR